MLRTLLFTVLPLVLPTALYAAWLYAEHRRRAAAGAGTAAPRWAEAPWVALAGIGLVLMIVTLALWSAVGESDPGAEYQPPRLEDGRIVPGEMRPPAESAE